MPRRPTTRLSLAAVGLVGGLLLGSAACSGEAPSDPVEAADPTPPAPLETSTPPPAPAAVRGVVVLAVLERVRIAPTRYVPGYDRSCAAGRACSFGPAWTDGHAGPGGRNGCDTRQDVLLRQMTAIERRWGAPCRIYQARLTDPYTGRALTWRRDGARIQVDHVYPLAEAWYAGAAAWPPAERVRFANDVRRELLAVSAAANQAKGGQTPAEWLPAYRPFRCTYVLRYLRVARHYDLSVTPADADAVRRVARGCR